MSLFSYEDSPNKSYTRPRILEKVNCIENRDNTDETCKNRFEPLLDMFTIDIYWTLEPLYRRMSAQTASVSIGPYLLLLFPRGARHRQNLFRAEYEENLQVES